jgi:IS5 family transposase
MPAHHEQIGQRAGHEQAMGVLLQPAIAHLGKAEHPLDDPDRVFDPGPHFRNAPSSTKNADKARDPEMHQTKKGNQWYFGMKAHLGVDSRTKLIHAVVATPANIADSTVLPELLHGQETRVWGDQAYRGQRAVIREHAPKARDFTNRRYRHCGVVDEV